MQKRKIIFVLGHGRSGTTLLNKILCSHPEICFISEEFNDLPFFFFSDRLYNKYVKKQKTIKKSKK